MQTGHPYKFAATVRGLDCPILMERADQIRARRNDFGTWVVEIDRGAGEWLAVLSTGDGPPLVIVERLKT